MAKRNYDNWSKEELLREVEKLEKKLKKNYGLVWEDKLEDVAKLCKEKLPVLIEDKSKEIATDSNKPTNILIEGNNYHVLSVLNYTHKGQIDAIYIDPPYNTGKKDEWKYNDDWIDKEDTYRHSKWLSFMEKRLKLAKNLLSRNGTIFISIDDNELAQLRLLCNEVFLENNFIELFCWNKTMTPPSLSNKSRSNVEYIICYEKNKNNSRYFGKISSNSDAPLLNKGNGEKTLEFPKGSIRFNIPDGMYKKGKYGDIVLLKDFEVKKSINKDVVLLNGEFKWVQKNLDGEIKLGTYFLIKSKKMAIRYKKEDSRVNEMIPNKFIDRAFDVGTNESATKELEVLDISFNFPKPVSLIKFLINMVCRYNKNALILDFFAGSGTTGHAVLEINKEDEGNRKFILCTNNENNIATEVCYPRIQKVISGYKYNGDKVRGLGGNLRYFKTDFVDANPTDRNKKKLVDKSTEMLCLKEDCFDEVKNESDFKIFKNSQNKYLGIIYDDDGIESFKKEAKKMKNKFVVYVFSLDESAREEEFEDMSDTVKLKPIPAVILNVYKRIFK